MARSDGPQNGETAEEWVADAYGYEIDRQQHHDLRDGDRRVQVKAARDRMGYDPSRRGRFRVWDEELTQADSYVLVVYEQIEDSDEIEILRHKEIEPAAIYDAMNAADLSWTSAGRTATDNERQTKISWAAFWPEAATR